MMASTCTPPSAGDCEQTGAAESDFPTMVDAIQHTYFDDEDNAQVDAMHSNENLCDSFSGALKAEGSAPTVEAHRPLKRGLKRKRHRTNSSSIKPREGTHLVATNNDPPVGLISKRSRKRKKAKRRTLARSGKSNISIRKETMKGDREISASLVSDVERDVSRRVYPSPSFLKLSTLDEHWSELCAEHSGHSKRCALIVDVGNFFRNRNPFMRTVVEEGGKAHAKSFHDDVRLLVRMLRHLADFLIESGKEEDCSLMLENFTPKAIGWLHSFVEEQLPTCPVVLQERIRDLFLRTYKRTASYVFSTPFLKPAMFIDVVVDRREVITSLNLGELKTADMILQLDYPNLRELVWHNANMENFTDTSFPELRVLSLTASASAMTGFEVVRRCPRLVHLYTGLKVPDDPTRFDLDVLLRSYQTFWNTAAPSTEGRVAPLDEDAEDSDGGRAMMCVMPELRHLSFWNAPEKVFTIMAKNGIRLETLQFGQLDQSLSRLCSLDSIMQALFKFNQPKYECYKLAVSHLKMYLHAMPVVSLDYYLPQLMMGINDALSCIRSLDLFVHCSFSSSMPSSWVLEGRPRNSSSKLTSLTHFSFHIDGFCVFEDLDCHLPPSTSCVTISLSLPTIGAKRCVSSLLQFIRRLASVNAYPDLEELHLQVWGIRCAEKLLNRVTDHLSDVRRLSVIAMPLEEDRSRLIDLISHVASSCHRLESLRLSAELMRLLIDEYGDLWKTNWRMAIARVAKECGLRDSCDLEVDTLPRVSGCDEYFVVPSFPQAGEADVESSESAKSEDESRDADADVGDSDICSNDSFVVGDEALDSGESEDALDLLDQQLEGETDRRHERYMRKIIRHISTSSEGEQQGDDDEDESDVEYITDYEDEEDEQDQNPFIDGEAEQVESGAESEDGSETEPEGENAAFSSDEEMLEAAVQMINARPRRNCKEQKQKKHLIVSDSEED